MFWMECFFEGPYCSLKHVRVHITADIVPDEGLRVPDHLDHGVDGLSVSAGGAPPDQGPGQSEVSILTNQRPALPEGYQVAGPRALPGLAHQAAVEGAQLRGVRAAGARAGEPDQ